MKRDQIHREQPSLFAEAHSTIDDAGRVTRRARATDPETSHAGAAHIAKDLTVLQQRMLKSYGSGKTDNESAALCVAIYGEKPHETYRKRAGEIRDHLTCIGTRKNCGYTTYG